MATINKSISKMSNQELIAECVRYDELQKKNKQKVDSFKTELQKRAILIMNDKNVKFVKFYGSNCFASVTDSLKLEVLNMERLKEVLGEGIIKEQVTQTEKIDYKWKTKFERVLKVIFTGDYTFEMTLEEFLDQMSRVPDAAQKKLLLKNLKGDYEKDRETLWTTFGYLSKEEQPDDTVPDFDVELYYIYKIKNGELLKAFLPEENRQELIENVKKCILVENSTAIKVDYKKEESEE